MQNIYPKTEIRSDGWRAYIRIKNEGFDHYTVTITQKFFLIQTLVDTLSYNFVFLFT